MSAEITMPQLSDTMSEGTVVKWKKKEGDPVKQGEIVAEVETDKATMEMEAFETGTLARILVKEGEKTSVGKPIAVLATGKESIDEVRAKYAQGAAPAATAPAPAAKQAAPQQAAAPAPKAAPAPAATSTAVATAVAESDDNGNRPLRVSPLARRIAADKGIDLARVQGSGPSGRIIQRDVESAASAGPARPMLPIRVGSGRSEVIELSKMRLAIARNLVASKQSVPHFYESIDADVEELSLLRAGMNKRLASQKIRLSLSDFVTRAVTVALLDHPALNATFDGERVTRWGDVHLGMAVAIPDGLIVPVLRNADQMDVKEIRSRSVDLVERARQQKLKQTEMRGATFTVSNLGAYGINEFSAIINPPEVAILAVGAAQKRAVVHGDAIVARSTMTLTLSADHRAVDGATAADFLRTLRDLLQEPGMLLA
jgi:pyruvate dehydrogenase E2 component (dihydrolipoamide acetyltransferase)